MEGIQNKEFDKEAFVEARKKEMEDISAKLEKGVQDVFNGEGFGFRVSSFKFQVSGFRFCSTSVADLRFRFRVSGET